MLHRRADLRLGPVRYWRPFKKSWRHTARCELVRSFSLFRTWWGMGSIVGPSRRACQRARNHAAEIEADESWSLLARVMLRPGLAERRSVSVDAEHDGYSIPVDTCNHAFNRPLDFRAPHVCFWDPGDGLAI